MTDHVEILDDLILRLPEKFRELDELGVYVNQSRYLVGVEYTIVPCDILLDELLGTMTDSMKDDQEVRKFRKSFYNELCSRGLVYSGADPDYPKAFFQTRTVWSNKKGWTRKYKSISLIVKNNYIWSGEENTPEKEKSDGKWAVLIYGFMPNQKGKMQWRKQELFSLLINENNTFLKNGDKPKIKFGEDLVDMMVQWVVMYVSKNKEIVNQNNGIVFKDKRGVYLVFPKFIYWMAEYFPWNSYRFPKNEWLPHFHILNKLQQHHLVMDFDNRTYAKIIPGTKGWANGGVRVVGIDKEGFEEEVFNEIPSVDIRIIPERNLKKTKTKKAS